MNNEQAKRMIQDALEEAFDKANFVRLVKNILNHVQDAPFTYTGNLIFNDFKDSVQRVDRIGKYRSPDKKQVDILIVYLKEGISLERARTKQRNYVAKYLKGSRGGVFKDAALVAFVAHNKEDWRFSFVKVEYVREQRKATEKFTPARRYSFLVGPNEKSHTAQSRLMPALLKEDDPTLGYLEEIFSVEPVTREFFDKYRDLFHRLEELFDNIRAKDSKVRDEFEARDIDTAEFAKKLLGQIVFLYFLQRKGWFGVKQNGEWGDGSKNFLRELFEKKHGDYQNFFNDILEPLFYNTLAVDRSLDWSDQFNCRIPFLNGGLFDPFNKYDWEDTDILLPDGIFSNSNWTKEDDTGDGILDIFDRYNFTVNENEPLEKEVAVDPEMLGKVFEKLLKVKDRKSQGAFYTPREIVHQMCRTSLINHLVKEFDQEISREDIETLVEYADIVVENERHVAGRELETRTYTFKMPEGIRKHADLLDKELDLIRVCDPAAGSGAFLVGMMNEIVRLRHALSHYIGDRKERPSYQLKRQAIESCLYGVDINSSAVEIARLRFWLSLVVDEEDRKEIQPLPNLDYRIMQGNSLLSLDRHLGYYGELDEFVELKRQHFKATAPNKREEYERQIKEHIRQIAGGYEGFNFKVHFLEIFQEEQGFDIVVANPPYVDSEEMTKTGLGLREVYSSTFKSAKGNWDLYVVFVERGLQILKKDGIISYIVPNKLIGAKYAESLREILLRKNIKEIQDFSIVEVFEDVSVSTIVFAIQNTDQRDPSIKSPVVMTAMKALEEVKSRNVIPAEKFYKNTDWAVYFTSKKIVDLVMKISESSPLGELCERISDAASVSEAYKIRKFVKEITLDSKRSKKLCNTGTIDPYLILWGQRKTRYIKGIFDKPIIMEDDLRSVSLRRLEQARTSKIMIGGMSKDLECAYDDGDFLAGKSTIIILEDPSNKIPLKVLLALLNSTLISFWYRHFFGSSVLGTSLQIGRKSVSQIPIVHVSRTAQGKLTNLVDNILAITGTDDYLQNPTKQAQVCAYEKEIDKLVYGLYDLTPDEIEIIEANPPK